MTFSLMFCYILNDSRLNGFMYCIAPSFMLKKTLEGRLKEWDNESASVVLSITDS